MTVIGWDIGGAHVKAALWRDGHVHDVAQWPCALWQGLGRLEPVLAEAQRRWPAFAAARHAVTMTGEMVDGFADRAQGVAALVGRLAQVLGPDCRFFALPPHGWLDAGTAASRWRAVASANWRATAQAVAARLPDAVLVDVGSTTTDLVALVDGAVRAQACDDAGRLASGELVYLGVVRTPLMALGARAPWAGRSVNVMNELFATTADVFRLLGDLDPVHDQQPTADGGDRDAVATCRRLARMVGCDAADAPPAAWHALASHWRDHMTDTLAANLVQVLARAGLPGDAPLVAAGCGAFVVPALARRLGRRAVDIATLLPVEPVCAGWARVAAPSVAVALLFAEDGVTCGS